MKKTNLTLAAVLVSVTAAAFAVTGCGGKGKPEETTAAQETLETAEMTELEPAESLEESDAEGEDTEKETVSEDAKEDGEKQTEEKTEKKTGGKTAAEAQKTADGYEDNFAVDSKAAAEFADKIKEVVAAKDLEALADLTAFPVYVDIENSNAVKTREEFIALGADAIFTEGLMNSVANADTENMQPSMAGFSISDGGSANINFGVRDGVLAINGINY